MASTLATVGESADPLDEIAFLKDLFRDEPNARSVMFNIADELGDGENKPLWQDAFAYAERMDGMSGSDGFLKEIMTANSGRLSVWIRSCEVHLKEMTTRRTPLIYPMDIRRAFRQAKSGEWQDKMLLGDIARFARHAFVVRRFQKAAQEIYAERERRLKERFGIAPHQDIPSMTYCENPWYEQCTYEDVVAYLNGDRSERIFSIDPPAKDLDSTRADRGGKVRDVFREEN